MFSLGGSYDLLNLPKGLQLVGLASLNTINANFLTVQQELIDFNGDATYADINHKLDIRFWNVTVGAGLVVPIGSIGSLRLGLAGVVPISTTYEISETLVNPGGVVFETGSSSRNLKSGTVSAANGFLAVPIGLSGPIIQIGKHLGIQPSLSASMSLSSITRPEQWTYTSVGFGLNIRRIDTVETYDTTVIKLPEPPPPVIEPEKKQQMISVAGGAIMKDSDDPVTTVVLTYSTKRRRLAVLPAVYFDSASSVVPDRYLLGSGREGGLKSLTGAKDIDVNHAILDLLATSLRANPNASVIITACHADDGPVQTRTALARARGQSIIDHLTSKYGVSSSQLSLRTRDIPERSSSVRTPMGRAENRRVEFTLKNTPYELPVQADTLIVQGFESVSYGAAVSRPETVASWDLQILAGKAKLLHQTGTGDLPPSRKISLTTQQQQEIRRAGGADIVVSVDDTEDGKIIKRTRLVSVESRADDVRPFDEFGIVLFDYNSSRVSDDEMPTIKDLQERAARADYIQITGTADASGSQEYNLKLAGQRAMSVVRELKLPPGTYELKSEISEDYPVELPEGRMLGRQVKVVMRTGK
jgi:outer membrane protein OmpA-like peptidoglycan-associated protein